jgi:hypothetical protein
LGFDLHSAGFVLPRAESGCHYHIPSAQGTGLKSRYPMASLWLCYGMLLIIILQAPLYTVLLFAVSIAGPSRIISGVGGFLEIKLSDRRRGYSSRTNESPKKPVVGWHLIVGSHERGRSGRSGVYMARRRWISLLCVGLGSTEACRRQLSFLLGSGIVRDLYDLYGMPFG